MFNIRNYEDVKMAFRRSMIKNLHYMSRLDDEIINEIICCLDVKRFAKDSVILKSGDISNVIIYN